MLDHLKLFVPISLLSVLVAACGSATTTLPKASTPLTNGPHSSTTFVPALITHNPKVVVTPSTNLVDGQSVEVSVSGFGVGGKFFLSECSNAKDANSAGCGLQLAAQPMGVTNSSGQGNVIFRVSSVASGRPYSNSQLSLCTTKCVLVVTLGINFGYAYAPLTFGK